MNLLKELKKLILPILRRFYWVVLAFSLAVGLAIHYVKYTTPMYESVSRIKLDDKKVGLSNNNLYYDFDVFSSINKVETEVEVLKSRMLWERVLQRLHFEILLYRVGKIKKTQLYNDSPIIVEHAINNHELFDKSLQIQVLDSNSYQFLNSSELGASRIGFGDTVKYKYSWFRITRNDDRIRRFDLNLIDLYEFKVLSPETLISGFNEKNIDIVAIDKEVAVIRIAFKNDHPQKAADFANALAEEYINDYISSKSFAAAKTLEFIDDRLASVQKDLVRSEIVLERFKKQFGVINTLQETETGIRKTADMKVQLINMEMNEEAIESLEKYLETGEYFDETAIQFGFGDLTFTELVKKLALYNEERRNLLNLYTEQSPRIQDIDENIRMVKNYIRFSIKQAKRDIELKREKINLAYEKAKREFDDLPERERNYITLDREFHLNERMYNFLAEKRIEASIASAALISFHRIIQFATAPEKPVSPNKTLILFVSGLFGLIIGITIAFTQEALTAKVASRADIEKASAVPVLGIVKHFKNEPEQAEQWFLSLAKTMALEMPDNYILSVTSGTRLEGKTTVSQGLARAFAQMGNKVVWIDMDTTEERSDSGEGVIQILSGDATVERCIRSSGHNLDTIALGKYIKSKDHLLTASSLGKILKELKRKYEFVIVDAPSMLISANGYLVLTQADAVLYILRSQYTKLEFVTFIDQVKDKIGEMPMHAILNDVKGSQDLTGQYQGGTFTNLPLWRRLLNRIELPKLLRRQA